MIYPLLQGAKLAAHFGELELFQFPNNRLPALIFLDLFIQNVLSALERS